MQDQAFKRLVKGVQEAAPPTAKQRIRQAFESVRDNGDMLTLSNEEVRMLYDFRVWKASADSVRGVFHWKRLPAKELDREPQVVED